MRCDDIEGVRQNTFPGACLIQSRGSSHVRELFARGAILHPRFSDEPCNKFHYRLVSKNMIVPHLPNA